MPRFCAGIKFTSGDLNEEAACLKHGRTVFLGSNTIIYKRSAGARLRFSYSSLDECESRIAAENIGRHARVPYWRCP